MFCLPLLPNQPHTLKAVIKHQIEKYRLKIKYIQKSNKLKNRKSPMLFYAILFTEYSFAVFSLIIIYINTEILKECFTFTQQKIKQKKNRIYTRL